MRFAQRWAVPAAAALAAAALVASGPAITAGAADHRSQEFSPADRRSQEFSPADRRSQEFSPVGGRFYGVSADSPTDVWAVGLSQTGSLIQHFNGSTWSTALDSSGYLVGVDARYWNDVWAVGGSNWFSPVATVIWHYDGSSWTRVPSPSPGEGGYLNGVVATSRGNAWAVGLIAPGGNGVRASYTAPLVEHWDGTKWQVQPVVVPAAGGQFRGVAATSRNDVWAVGWTGGNSLGTTRNLIEHWNGSRWAVVPSPDPAGSVSSGLDSVSVISPTNAWAVGTSSNGSTAQTMIEHWDGQSWTIVPSPTPDGDDQLNSVAAISATYAWAVGLTNPSRCSNGPVECGTLIEHWNGQAWSVVPSPDPPADYLNALWGVVSFYRNAWAVGSTDYGSTLILHYNGRNWSY
jgi:hypothetical protein